MLKALSKYLISLLLLGSFLVKGYVLAGQSFPGTTENSEFISLDPIHSGQATFLATTTPFGPKEKGQKAFCLEIKEEKEEEEEKNFSHKSGGERGGFSSIFYTEEPYRVFTYSDKIPHYCSRLSSTLPKRLYLIFQLFRI